MRHIVFVFSKSGNPTPNKISCVQHTVIKTEGPREDVKWWMVLPPAGGMWQYEQFPAKMSTLQVVFLKTANHKTLCEGEVDLSLYR